MRSNKRNKRILLVVLSLVTLLACGLLLVACQNGDEPAESATEDNTQPVSTPPEGSATEPSDTEEPPTEAVTDKETDPAGESETVPAEESESQLITLWTPDTGTFNEGNVVYEKTVETQIVEQYPDEKLGQSMKPGEMGVITVFSTDYSSGDPTCDGQATLRNSGLGKVIDGIFYFPYDGNSADKIISDGWSTYSLVPGASVKQYKQVSLSMDWTVISRGSGAWFTAMWGCYVTNYTGKIPDGPGDGLWLSFNAASHTISVYHPDVASWPAGWGSIPVDQSLMSGMFHTDIVCTSDYTTYIYMTAEGSDQEVLVGYISFADGKIRTYDGANNMLQEADCSTDSLKGENFVMFTHGGGGAYIDNLAILAGSRGEVLETVTVTATPTEGHTLGLDITDKTDLVSICYSIWFDAILGGGTEKVETFNNITEALAGNQPWGGETAFHYWAKPAQGYYRSSDKDAIRQNMTWLYEAGVDFIIIDLTNAGDGYIGNSAWITYIDTPMRAMLDTIMEMRAEGKGTPYVAFWSGDSKGPLYQALYDTYHAVDAWKDCFVYWDGKPLLLTTHTDPAKFPLSDLYTVRMMWGLNNDHSTYHWNFLNINNYNSVSPDADGNPEQISVAVATQETYMSRTDTAHGRNHGIFWYAQWAYAFEVHPKIVTLTWWNEWCAQRLNVNGEYVFTDNYTQEYSRDIEPMEGGHGDQYYQWMKQYISAYKSGIACPVLVEEGYEDKAEVYYQAQQKGR